MKANDRNVIKKTEFQTKMKTKKYNLKTSAVQMNEWKEKKNGIE